jgi:hypothetical protein
MRPAPPAAASAASGTSVAGSALVTIDEVRRQWARVLEDIKRKKMICHALLIDGTPLEVTGDLLTVGLRSAYAFHMESLNKQENREIVEGALSRVLARPVRFKCLLYDTPAATASGGPPGPATTAPGTGDPSGSPAAEGGLSFVERARQLFGAEIVDDRPAP